jgi:hypothetical protein
MFGFFKKKTPDAKGPDFSNIDSRAKAEAMFRKGELEKLFLLPLQFGGQDIAENVLFVPAFVVAVKAGIDVNIIAPLVAEGKVTQYNAEPDYQGDSFIPISIKITAWDPGQFSSTINIWGAALTQEQGDQEGNG